MFLTLESYSPSPKKQKARTPKRRGPSCRFSLSAMLDLGLIPTKLSKPTSGNSEKKGGLGRQVL